MCEFYLIGYVAVVLRLLLAWQSFYGLTFKYKSITKYNVQNGVGNKRFNKPRIIHATASQTCVKSHWPLQEFLA